MLESQQKDDEEGQQSHPVPDPREEVGCPEIMQKENTLMPVLNLKEQQVKHKPWDRQYIQTPKSWQKNTRQKKRYWAPNITHIKQEYSTGQKGQYEDALYHTQATIAQSLEGL
jgi:hypothetical protein